MATRRQNRWGADVDAHLLIVDAHLLIVDAHLCSWTHSVTLQISISFCAISAGAFGATPPYTILPNLPTKVTNPLFGSSNSRPNEALIEREFAGGPWP